MASPVSATLSGPCESNPSARALGRVSAVARGANSKRSSLSLDAFDIAESSDDDESEDKVNDTLVAVLRIRAGLGVSSSSPEW